MAEHAHCFHRDRDGLVPQIVGPVRTMLRYACCTCGEPAYLGVGLDDEGNARSDAPPGASGTHMATPPGAERCTTCGQCPPDHATRPRIGRRP